MRLPQKIELEFASFHSATELVSLWLIVRTYSQSTRSSSAIYNLWTNVEPTVEPWKRKAKERKCVVASAGKAFNVLGFYGENWVVKKSAFSFLLQSCTYSEFKSYRLNVNLVWWWLTSASDSISGDYFRKQGKLKPATTYDALLSH